MKRTNAAAIESISGPDQSGSTFSRSIDQASRLVPLTASGWIVLLVGVATFAAGLWLGWIELFVISAGCLIALLAAIPFLLGRTRLTLERHLDPDRVTAGESSYATFTVTNELNRPTPPRRIHDHVDGRARPIDVPALTGGNQWATSWRLPTQRRGVHRIGPARVTMADPFRLMLREVGHTGIDKLWVQPSHLPLRSPGAGLAKDVDGPTYDTSPAGDIAFHAVRPYRSGDDIRHIHWMSTARAGEVMVRHYVDNRVPSLAVVIDTNRASWTDGDEFDVGVEIAASLVISAMRSSRPVSLHLGDNTVLGANQRLSVQGVLDELTLLNLEDDFDLTSRWPLLLATQHDISLTVGITGASHDNDVVSAARALRSIGRRSLVQVADEQDVSIPPLMGMSRHTVATVRQFARVWHSQAAS